MQNFRNNSVPPALPPGFSGGSAVGGGNASYLSQSSGPQCSPRMAEEYAVVQQQAQQNPQRPNQHPHQLVTHHPTHASHILGYAGRNRATGTGEALHSHANSGGSSISNNPYRKEMMDHYFSMSGKDRHRRGGQALGYGLGFGYPNMDGHIPHQYRHAGAGSSGMMAHYQLDYSAAAGSGGTSNSGSSSGTGAFSPSHQYSLSQNTPIQTAVGPPIHSRQQAQNYSSQQALHQGQQHRGYPTSGHRLPLQFPLYSSPNAPTGTPGMYNSPPLRYHGGSNSGGFECKVNSSSTANTNPSSVSSANSNNIGPIDGAGQSYPSSGYSPYHSQPSHSLHKHPAQPHRGSHHNLSLGYDAAHKIHSSSLLHQSPAPGLTDPENRATSSTVPSTNPSMPHFSSQEISKSPMHSQSHQPQVHQNFSPISNPSPAASTVQSPSCSSSPSPLMGISETGNSTGPATLQKTRTSHSQSRLLQTVSQLSPAPNSNSSISSCGSGSGNVNTAGLNSNSVSVRTCMAMGVVGVREENSSTLYPSSPLDKLMPESAINSLNALTSQVANLPNTVQHMLLSDSLVSQKTGKDGGFQDHMREHLMQQSSHALPTSQQRNRGISDTFIAKAAREGIGTFSSETANSEDAPSIVPESPVSGREGEEQFSGGEGERVRQMSGASSSSEPTGYYALSQNRRNQIQSQTEQGAQSLPLQVEIGAVTQKNQALTSLSVSQPRKNEACGTFPKSPLSSSPSSHPPSAQPSPNQTSSCPPVSLVPTFSSPSSSLISSFHPSHVKKAVVDSQKSGRERVKEEGEGKGKKEENEERSEEWKSSKETKVNSKEEKDRDKQGVKEEIVVHTHPSKRKPEEQEKQEKAKYLDDPSKNLNTEETYNTGVGVIVSTRSEILQSATITEPQTATCAAPHSLRQSHNLRNYSEEVLSRSSAGDSNDLNGEDDDRLCTYSSNHGTKVPHKLGSEHSLSPPPPSSDTRKVPFGSSELHHGSEIGLKNRGRGGMGTNVKYHGYHQPQPSYNSGPRKGAGVDELSRRGNGFDAGRGQEYNSQLQQQLQQPSLLQEVLQGYHLDRRYGRTENSAQKISKAYSQSQNTAHQSHPRHPYVMPENVRPHVLVPETGIHGDHQSHTHTAASGKRHPPNQGQGSEHVVGQDSSTHSLGSGGLGAKEEHCSADKHQTGTTRSHSTPSMEQSTESSPRPPPKHINLADYSLPHRRPSSNLSAHNSAVQQILLQDTETMAGIGVPKSQTQPHASSSLLSSERRSVICDISPSRRTTPERERDGEVDHGRSHPQTGSSVASVIQQSHSTPSAIQESENSKAEKSENKAVDFKPISKEAQNLTSSAVHIPAKEPSVQNQNRSPRPSVDTSSDTQQFSSARKGESNSISSPTCHPKQATQHPSSNPSPLSSPPSRCQPYFQGLDEVSGHSTGLGRYGLGEMRVGTPKAISYQPQYPLHPHHNVPSQAQLENSKSLKLQMYPHPHPLNQSHVLDERCDWTASNSNRSTENTMMSPRSGRPRHQSPPGRRSLDSLPAPQPHLQGNYYDPVKMWGLSERDGIGTMEGGNSRRNQVSAAASGAVALPATPASGARCVQSNTPREELVKSLHQMPTSSSHNQSVCSNSSSSNSTNVNLGVQQGHGQNRTVGSGDTNPLMMRRRVRSFISPIPAKRQHQDISQHQRGSSSQYPAPLPNSESKHQNDASLSPDPSQSKMAIPNAPSPTHGKTKILPPRKGRGLKLEAIVQKITPNVKKTTNNNSHTNSASNHLSGLPHSQVTDCNSETQEQDACVESNFSRVGTVTGSCLPYLGEGLSLDEIMYYRGVEETGPLPPTAYPCDPHQDPQMLKRDATGNMTRNPVGDLEPDFGINTTVSPMTERDGVVERAKDELQIDSDFPLLGPLPPPPPLPCPVQASPPPSSSALSDIQHFTNTYQQLETRKGEHSAANLLRQKLQETGMGLGMDDFTGNDYFGTQPAHHNPDIGACLLNRAPHVYQQHLIPSARTASSMAGLSQLPEPKPPESAVPKGYFPSGKKKGRPVGSVNKQKRAQAQAHNASLNTPTVNVNEAPPLTPTHTPAYSATSQIVSSASSSAETSETFLPNDNKISSASVSPAASQTVKTDAESEDLQPEIKLNSVGHDQRTGEGEEGDKVWVGNRQRRRRRRGVVAMVGKEELQAGTQVGGKFVAGGSFTDYRSSAFAPYIHVERKEVEMGAVCTIVNAEDELMKGENGGEGGIDVILTPISSSQGDREIENMREKKEPEPVSSVLLESCTTGKALPSSGYVLSGAVSTELGQFGQLLCCLCKKWANYKNLGDLYGPYYPPEYASKLPKSHPQTRQSLLTCRAGSIGVSVGTASTESMKPNIQTIEAQTAKSVMETQHIGYQDVDPVSVSIDTVCPVVSRDMHALPDRFSSVDADSEEPQQQDLGQDVMTNDGLLQQSQQQSELEEKPESQLQNQQWPTEEIHQRPQHRKLTSHPRFKRRHKSSEDLPKSTPTNNKALLPFQPPPQPLNQDASEPLSQLAQLPQVPLDPEELWVHESCIVWASGVYLVNGRLYGLKEALDGASDTSSLCVCCSAAHGVRLWAPPSAATVKAAHCDIITCVPLKQTAL
ncbi:transcription factor 20 isoform X2 [Conger conger]|uniref:transcription factor 20 isoform X2 n=1 Tax=Conger conger TaxID=82655 RepID=UPI002A59BFB9|nr:transcription factor 20 isoform X2 [Conger conger]